MCIYFHYNFYTCVFISIIFFFMHVYLYLIYIYGITIVVNLPPTLAKSQVSSVRKNLKMHMLSLLRHPASQDHITQITTLLTDLGATNSEVRPNKRYISLLLSLVLWLDNNQQIRCTDVVLLLCYPHRVASWGIVYTCIHTPRKQSLGGIIGITLSVRPTMYLVSTTLPKRLIGFLWNFTHL
jgi:hypothetical protein